MVKKGIIFVEISPECLLKDEFKKIDSEKFNFYVELIFFFLGFAEFFKKKFFEHKSYVCHAGHRFLQKYKSGTRWVQTRYNLGTKYVQIKYKLGKN